MKRVFEKLASSLFLLLIASSFIVTSTFAWFSLNTEGTITGMIVNVETYDNLLIAPDTIESSVKASESDFKNDLVTPLRGYLEPVSTVDALKFYYTKSDNVDAVGDALSEKYIPYDQYASEEVYGRKPLENDLFANLFSENYGVRKDMALAVTGTSNSAIGYVDYVFQLKAINSSSVTENIVLDQLEVTYLGVMEDNNAFRVAIFVQDITSDTPAGADEDNLKGIYKKSQAKNFVNSPVNQAVNSTSTLGNVTYVSSAEALATVAPKSVAYYKIIVRIWLEGEDDTCNVETYLELDSKWGLEVAFELKQDLSGCVTYLRDVSVITAASYSVEEYGKVNVNIGEASVDLNRIPFLMYNGEQVYTTASPGALQINAELFTVSGTTATNVNEFFRLQ